MTGNKRWFVELDEQFRHSVKLRNDLKMPVTGKGNIKLAVDDTTQVLSEVYYVAELKNNVKHCQLQEKGLAVLIQIGECRVFHSRRGLIMRTCHMTTNRMIMVLASVLLNT